MPELTVEFEVYCSCGNGLCGNATVRTSRNRGVQQLVIEPCEKCLEVARDEAADRARREVEVELSELQERAADGTATTQATS